MGHSSATLASRGDSVAWTDPLWSHCAWDIAETACANADLPALLGPSSTVKGRSSIEVCRNPRKFRRPILLIFIIHPERKIARELRIAKARAMQCAGAYTQPMTRDLEARVRSSVLPKTSLRQR